MEFTISKKGNETLCETTYPVDNKKRFLAYAEALQKSKDQRNEERTEE